MKIECSRQIFGNKAQISNSIKIRPVKVELVHADRRTDGQRTHDKATTRF